MVVGAARHAELEGIGADARLDRETVLQGLARVLGVDHAGRLRYHVEVALVPDLEAGELVGRRERRMLLARALALRDLVERFVLGAGLRPVTGDRVALEGGGREHQPVREVAVVRDGEQLAAGALLVGLHPLPQVLGVLGHEGGERRQLVGERLAVTVDDVAVQVVAAAVVGGPLVGDEGREAARIVVALHDRRHLVPHVERDRRILHRRRQLALALQRDAFKHGRVGLLRIGVHLLVPALEHRVGHQLGVAGDDLAHDAHGIGVVRDREPVERTGEPHGDPGARDDLLAAREPQRLLRTDARAGADGVRRPRGVQVLVAPVDARRIAARRVGREAGFAGRCGLGRGDILALLGAGRLRRRRAAAALQQEQRDHGSDGAGDGDR